MCSGGGGSDPVTTVVNTASDNTPDVKIEVPEIKVEPPPPIKVEPPPPIKVEPPKINPQDVVDTISDITPDIKITDTSTGDIAEQVITVPEVLNKVDEIGGATGEVVKDIGSSVVDVGSSITDAIGEATEGSDVDTFLKDSKDTGDLMLDTVITIATGEPHGKVKETQESLQETQQDYQDLGDDIQTGVDNLEDVTTDTIGTTNEVLTDIGTNVAEQFSEAMGLTDETEGGAVTEETRGGDVERDDLMLTLGKKKSELKAQKKKGKRGLRIDYGVSLPGSGKAGIAA